VFLGGSDGCAANVAVRVVAQFAPHELAAALLLDAHAARGTLVSANIPQTLLDPLVGRLLACVGKVRLPRTLGAPVLLATQTLHLHRVAGNHTPCAVRRGALKHDALERVPPFRLEVLGFEVEELREGLRLVLEEVKNVICAQLRLAVVVRADEIFVVDLAVVCLRLDVFGQACSARGMVACRPKGMIDADMLQTHTAEKRGFLLCVSVEREAKRGLAHGRKKRNECDDLSAPPCDPAAARKPPSLTG